MARVLFFEGTITSSGRKRRKIVVYIPSSYYSRMEKYIGRKVKVLAIIDEDE